MIAPPRPPSHDALEALIKEARERQLRRRLLGAAGVAIVAALGLSIYAVSIGSGSAKVSQRSADTVRPCLASQLSATAGWQGATQSMLGGATITNTSTVACSIPSGRPAVQITWEGRTLRIREHKPPTPFGPGKPLRTLEPGASATIYLQWWNYCGARVDIKAPPTAYLRFRDGLVVAATASGQWGVPYCEAPGGVSTLYVSRPRTTD
jgi:uncharacterized protein DUF4232